MAETNSTSRNDYIRIVLINILLLLVINVACLQYSLHLARNFSLSRDIAFGNIIHFSPYECYLQATLTDDFLNPFLAVILFIANLIFVCVRKISGRVLVPVFLTIAVFQIIVFNSHEIRIQHEGSNSPECKATTIKWKQKFER